MLALPAAASGQLALCQPWPLIQKRLAERFNERPVSRGYMSGGAYFVIFASPDGLSWTAVRLSPNGTGCAIASGHGWKPGQNRKGEPL